jgi:Tol biopolymer transport system component
MAGDTNAKTDTFVHDTVTESTTRTSQDLAGTQADDHTSRPTISADGRYVVFESYASNLVPSDTNGDGDVFLKRAVGPSITSVPPTASDRGTSLTVTVAGTGFAAVSEAFFSGVGVVVTAVTVISETPLELAVTVQPGAALGARDLTVVDPGTLGPDTGARAACFAYLTIE